jgi:undecaprenyl pyrophosphate phosphatase UppP
MKNRVVRKFVEYVCNNYIGNFLGFVIGMASTRLVAHFFTTRSIRNLWGLTARKTVVDKHTYSTMEWVLSIIIGFIVFELVSKWLQKKVSELLPKYKLTLWMVEREEPGTKSSVQY